MKIVYHPKLTFGSRFLDRFHPFQFDRAESAYRRLYEELGEQRFLQPERPVTWDELSLVHSKAYLSSLRKTSVVASVVEVPLLSFCPKSWMRDWFLKPALWSVSATLLGARRALEEGFCLVLGGGFHHAKRERGEGFCFVNDINYALQVLRSEQSWNSDDSLLYVDLDVHQGNGVSDFYQNDEQIKIFDAFNCEIYPVFGGSVQGRVDYRIPLQPGCGDREYLAEVEQGLDHFLEDYPRARFGIYNAGTDVYKEDLLGGLKLSREGVNRRDLMVFEKFTERRIPLLALAGGGYSTTSADLLSDFGLGVCAKSRQEPTGRPS